MKDTLTTPLSRTIFKLFDSTEKNSNSTTNTDTVSLRAAMYALLVSAFVTKMLTEPTVHHDLTRVFIAGIDPLMTQIDIAIDYICEGVDEDAFIEAWNTQMQSLLQGNKINPFGWSSVYAVDIQ